MPNEVQKSKTLEERVTEKLHEQIGELITADDLQELVQRGIEDTLFKRRQESTGGYHSKIKELPSLAEEIVQQEMAEQMRRAVDQWIKDHPERIEELISKTLGDKAADLALQGIAVALAPAFQQVIGNMQAMGQLPYGSR